MTIRPYSPKRDIPPQTKPLTQRNAPPLYTVRITHVIGDERLTQDSRLLHHDAALRLLEHAAGLYGDVMHNILHFDVDANNVPVGFSARRHGDAALVATVRLVECE